MNEDIRFMETENKVILQLSGSAASDDELVEELYKLYRLFKKRHSKHNKINKAVKTELKEQDKTTESYDSLSKISFLKRVIISYKPSKYFTAKEIEEICKNLDYVFTASTISEYLRRLADENYLVRNEEERPITYGLVESEDPLIRYEFEPEGRLIKVLSPQITKE